MKKAVLKAIRSLQPGDLILVKFHDANIGSSLTLKGIPIPGKSLGIYLGSVGAPSQMILAQNDFKYTDEFHDVDYTAVPEAWTNRVVVLIKSFMGIDEAELLLKSIVSGGGSGRRRRTFQRRVLNHEKID